MFRSLAPNCRAPARECLPTLDFFCGRAASEHSQLLQRYVYMCIDLQAGHYLTREGLHKPVLVDHAGEEHELTEALPVQVADAFDKLFGCARFPKMVWPQTRYLEDKIPVLLKKSSNTISR